MPYKVGFNVDIVCISCLGTVGKHNRVTERIKSLERYAVYGNEGVAAEVNVKSDLLAVKSFGNGDLVLEECAETVSAPVAADVKLLPAVIEIFIVSDILVNALTHLPRSGVFKVGIYSLFKRLELDFYKLVKGENTSLLILDKSSPCVNMSFHTLD